MDMLGRVNACGSHAVDECRVHGNKVLAEDVEAAVDSLYKVDGDEDQRRGDRYISK
jgi:hypothetical protein